MRPDAQTLLKIRSKSSLLNSAVVLLVMKFAARPSLGLWLQRSLVVRSTMKLAVGFVETVV